MRAAGEAAVRNQRNILSQAGAHDRGCWSEHLGHAGTALRPFIADDNHVASLDFFALESVQHVFLGVVNSGRTREAQPFLTGNLCNRTLWRQISLQDLYVPRLLQRIGERPHDLLAR